MGDLIEAAIEIVKAFFRVFLMVVLSVFTWTAAGWVIGWMFNEPFYAFIASLGTGTTSLEMWQIGMLIGFVDGFIRAIKL